MTRTNRKLVAFIIAVTFLLAALGALAWATSGFENWNAAEWFGGWGQGISAPVEVEDTAARVRTSSTEVDHEIITDSPDGSTMFATTKLPTPSLTAFYATDKLSVQLSKSSFAVGTVNVFLDPSGGNHYTLASFTEKDFTLDGSTYYAYIPLSTIREKLNTLNTSYGTIYARNVNKDGYVDSNDSTDLVISNVSEITTEFTNTTYKVKCAEDFYNGGYYQLNVCSSDRIGGAGSSMVFGDSILNLKGASYVTYADGYISVDLLSLSGTITTSLDRYYISFAYDFYKPSTETKKVSAFTRTFWNFNTFSVTHLPAPTNFTYNAGTLTWDSVDGATKYGVFWTEKGSEKKAFVDTTSYTFDINALGEGEHTVRVRALGNLGETAMTEGRTAMISAYNAANIITQVVALTYNVDGDVVTKFVPYGSNVKDYLYDVELDGREFGGWYYDSGFSSKVQDTDVISGDMTIYARLSDKAVEERPTSWWGLNKWKVLIPCFVFGGLLIIGGIAAVIVKKKKKA
ncbi:MAG: InlB B-repeat-containing protein [Clostridiales bacterium]|nr:InlB B-repeat-containing protein [Clostridiales bacterium]